MPRYEKLSRGDLTRLLGEAETLLRDGGSDDSQRLLYDLQLHQIELEIQNRDLRESQQVLEEARDRYAELYDFAPVGYLTLDRKGVIRNLNLTAATLLGRERSVLLNHPLSPALAPGTSRALFDHLRRAFATEERITGEFSLKPDQNGLVHELRLDSIVRTESDGGKSCLTALTDISERRRMEREVRASHAELSSLLSAAPVGIGLLQQRAFQWLSPRFLNMLGYTGAELLGRSSQMVYEDKAELERVIGEKSAQISGNGIGEIETRLHHKDGHLVDVLLRSAALDRDNPATGSIFTVLDISARKHAEERLHLAHSVLENTPEGIMITDPGLRIVEVNPAFTEITGYTKAEALGRRPDLLKSDRHDQSFYAAMWERLEQDDKWEGEIWNRRKNGDIYPQWLIINRIKDQSGQITHYAGMFSDITSQEYIRQRLHRLAYYDLLTGLPNRVLFRDQFTLLARQARRHQSCLALLFLDLDHFKQVNDILGHSKGDELLKDTAQRLLGCVRDSDVVARLGGDEFTVILPEIYQRTAAESVATKIVQAFDAPFVMSETEFFVTASIGISVYPDDGEDIDTLTKRADSAMYSAKQAGRNTYRFFHAELAQESEERVHLSGYLHHAVENRQLEVHYQPQISLRNGLMTGVEALVRWKHPQLGMVPPAKFIPIAEETGLITLLSDWVMRQALDDWSAHFKGIQRGHPPRLCVNISSVQFRQQNIYVYIADLLRQTGMEARHLELEITESALIQDANKATEELNALERLGVRIAIDDFCTGYSSLSYLARFPIHTVKIDHSFMRDLIRKEKHIGLISTIIQMGRNLDFDVIAEGVETVAQLAVLAELGCDQVQGFVFSRPTTAEKIALWARSRM